MAKIHRIEFEEPPYLGNAPARPLPTGGQKDVQAFLDVMASFDVPRADREQAPDYVPEKHLLQMPDKLN